MLWHPYKVSFAIHCAVKRGALDASPTSCCWLTGGDAVAGCSVEAADVDVSSCVDSSAIVLRGDVSLISSHSSWSSSWVAAAAAACVAVLVLVVVVVFGMAPVLAVGAGLISAWTTTFVEALGGDWRGALEEDELLLFGRAPPSKSGGRYGGDGGDDGLTEKRDLSKGCFLVRLKVK